MKTTNKLLIGLAILLFVIPLGSFIVWAKISRIDEDTYINSIDEETKSLEAKDHYYTSSKLEAFNKLLISNADRVRVNLVLVKSDIYGYKIDKEDNDLFSTTIDADGLLTFKRNNSGEFSNTTLYVYAPRFEEVTLSKIMIYNLRSDLDSLTVNLDGINESQLFGENKNLKSIQLNLLSSQISLPSVEEVNAFPTLKTIKVNLINSSFALNKQHFENVSGSLDHSTLYCSDDRSKGTLLVDEMYISTLGKSTIGFFEPEMIGKFDGVLSDSTSVLMPLTKFKDVLKK